MNTHNNLRKHANPVGLCKDANISPFLVHNNIWRYYVGILLSHINSEGPQALQDKKTRASNSCRERMHAPVQPSLKK